MKLATMSIFDFAYLYHQIYQVLYAKYLIVYNRILLIYCLDEEPKLINDLDVVSIDPEVTAHHQVVEKLFLEFRGLTNVKSDICQALDGLACDRFGGQFGQKVKEDRKELLMVRFVGDVRASRED